MARSHTRKPMPPSATSRSSVVVVVPASPVWYSVLPPLPPDPSSSPSTDTLSAQSLSDLFQRATCLHSDATNAIAATSSTVTESTSDHAFLQRILQQGTLSDRLSALTLLVQSSPLHNTRALDALKSLAERGKGKGGREESLKALRCVVDWWVGGGAPDRKLRYFRDQPLARPALDDRYLVIWFFEDWLKKYFFSILQILETLSTDPLPYIRTQALSFIFTLLNQKPEQEQNLLRLLVNKLGDLEKSICSRASHHLLQLLQAHPAMKTVVILEITSLVLRPSTATPATAPSSTDKPFSPPKKNTNEHARYYAAITLNQIPFCSHEKDVAVRTIDLYFQLFRDVLGEGRSSDDDHTDADPKSKSKQQQQQQQVKKVVGDAGFTEIEDAHSRLVSAILTGVNRALPFAKLGAADKGLNRHIDTLFLITHKLTFNISLQALLLIQQISATLARQSALASTSISDRYYRTLYASLHDERLATSSKQTMYLNLLFKSLKADDNSDRVKAFVRRFVQVLVSGCAGGNEFVVGGLYLLGEIFSTFPGLRQMCHSPSGTSNREEYDPRKRDPQYAHASASPLYELRPLLYHYHPTVSLHARQLLSGDPITSSADLTLNTLSHFLDRFVYKNPKKPRARGMSAMQPDGTNVSGASVTRTRGEVAGGVLPNEEKFWNRKVEDVPVDEVFFHKFFSQKHHQKTKGKKGTTKVGKEGDLEVESGSESHDDDATSIRDGHDEENEEEEDAIWKAMRKSMRGEGDDELLLGVDEDDAEDDLVDEDDEGDAAIESGDGGDEDEDEDEDEGGTEDDVSLAEGSDDDDLLAVDDIPGLLEYDGSDVESDDGVGGGTGDGEQDEDEDWGGLGPGDERKRKRGGRRPVQTEESGRSEIGSNKGRKKRRTLPTFASYEEYAKMIEEDGSGVE